MESIKTIAGRILLYFYSVQRSDYAKLNDSIIEFQIRGFSGKSDKSPQLKKKGSEVVSDLLKISENDNDIYNALVYLHDKNLIKMTKSPDNISDNLINISVSSTGIDMVEGIERGERERKNFYITFNIKLADNVNIENLIKAELGSLLKASLI